MGRLGPSVCVMLVCLLACGCKAPLSDLSAGFLVADAAWFAEEETLFIFYEVEATQGLGEASVLEVRYTTDDGVVPWTKLSNLPQVHTHLPIDCGVNARCGSGSLHVPKEPRDVGLRLRYHVDGALSLDADVVFNVVGPGPAHSHRSLTIYGVFDASNRGIEWRGRHRLPTVRNMQAQRLGLRRRFKVEAQRFGEAVEVGVDNPYLYGVTCPEGAVPLALEAVETLARAVFNAEDVSEDAAAAAQVCATSTVYDATGPFVAHAVARKNPEVRPAFPVLRSPVRDVTPIDYLLAFCDRTISAEHLAMQRQRLLLGDLPALCVDDWTAPERVAELVGRFRADIEQVRADGRDMVLVLALHHDAEGLAAVVEAALSEVMATEIARTTPRVVGAFVLDSYAHQIADSALQQTAIWCPASVISVGEAVMGEREAVGSGASLVCALIARPSLNLGPFSVSTLPILPSRAMYLDFIDEFGEAQAGRMTALTFRAPELPPNAQHVEVPPSGVATFFNDEVLSADADDAFSYCESEAYAGFVFRTATSDPIPIEALPALHQLAPKESYWLGLVWDFPFVIQLEYASVVAAAVSAFSVSLPFGVSLESEEDYGSELWLSEEISMGERLTQCRRFCDHPTFDAAGIYHVRDPFRSTYASACYTPRPPIRGGTEFPDDP